NDIVAGVCSRLLAAVDTTVDEEPTWPDSLERVGAQLRGAPLATPGVPTRRVAGEYGEGDLAVFAAILDGMTGRAPDLERSTAYLIGSPARPPPLPRRARAAAARA